MSSSYQNKTACQPATENPLDAFWDKYLEGMKDDDERRAQDWEGNTTGILTFTGLFAATVAAFVIESYKNLSADSGNETAELLRLLIAIHNSSALPIPSAPLDEPFNAPVGAVIVNVLWFCSLVISLGCALLATLVQQWARDYKRDMKSGEQLDEALLSRAFNHIYIRMGVDFYGMDQVVYLLVSLVHVSVFLFAGGLLLFLFPINSIVAWCTAAVFGFLGLTYLVASMLPIYLSSCPYKTPVTHFLAVIVFFSVWTVRRAISLSYALAIIVLRERRTRLYPLQTQSSVRIVRGRRRIYPSHVPLLSTRHFIFALASYVSRQTLCTDSDIATLLQAILRMIHENVLPASHRECIDHLCKNEMLRKRFQSWAWDPSRTKTLDAQAQVFVLQFTCVLLQRLNRLSDHDTTEEYRLMMKHCASILLNIIGPDGSFKMRANVRCMFSARCSLFYMRHYLLSPSSESTVANWHSSPRSSTGRTRQFSLGAESMAGELLTLLDTTLYNVVDVIDIPGSPYARGADRQSCLVPLHDGDCCRTPHGPPAHVAACNVLTMIAQVMYAPEHDRNAYLSSEPEFPATFFFDRESLKKPLPFWAWFEYFKMNEEDQRLPPSPEFQAIIRHVGKLGGLRTVRDGLYESFIDALRHLQDHVDTSTMSHKLEGHGGFGTWSRRMAGRSKPASMHEEQETSVRPHAPGDVESALPPGGAAEESVSHGIHIPVPQPARLPEPGRAGFD